MCSFCHRSCLVTEQTAVCIPTVGKSIRSTWSLGLCRQTRLTSSSKHMQHPTPCSPETAGHSGSAFATDTHLHMHVIQTQSDGTDTAHGDQVLVFVGLEFSPDFWWWCFFLCVLLLLAYPVPRNTHTQTDTHRFTSLSSQPQVNSD